MVDQTKRRIFELSERGMGDLADRNPTPCKISGALADCLLAAFARSDQALNVTYRKKLSDATNDDKSFKERASGERRSLIAAEKAWIAFRDAQCGYLSARQQGTEARLADLRCRMAMTVQRTKELKELQ
jgi:uncharacterized protein YecT (DUF1311 family)